MLLHVTLNNSWNIYANIWRCTKETTKRPTAWVIDAGTGNKKNAGEHPQKKSGNTQHTLQPGELLKGREKTW